MYAPSELKEMKFDKAVFGGYDSASVDEIFANVSEDYGALYKENATLKKKLKVLADTVEEYRSVDEAMRKALITAQNMANDMIAEAEAKRNEILENASAEAKTRIGELAKELADEEAKLAAAKKQTSEFIEKISALFTSGKNALEEIGKELSEEVKEQDTKGFSVTQDTVDEISKSLEEKVRLEEEQLRNEAEAEAEAEAQAPEASEEKEEEQLSLEEETTVVKKPKFEFTELKFGTDYDMSDEK